MPEENSICSEGCFYSGNDLNMKRISCFCEYDFDKRNKATKIEKQEVKENFLSYIFNMINYKIFTCVDIMNNWKNYISNYGFLIGAIIYLMIFILFIIYLCRGNKAIKIKYFLHEPKEDENNKKLYVIDLSEVSKKFKLSSSRHNIIINEQNSLFNDKNPKKMKSKIKSNPPNSKTKMNSSNQKQDINTIHKKIRNKKVKRIRSKIKDDEIHSNIIINLDNDIKKEEKNHIEYNELTYNQAIIKDERNIWQIFFSYFNEKLDLIQIIFYPKEFDHFSLSLTLYLYELLIDFTLNAILFSVLKNIIIMEVYYLSQVIYYL